MVNPDSTATTDLLEQLQAAAAGLLYISETEHPFEVVHLPHVQDSSMLAAALSEQPEVPENTEVETVALHDFFLPMTQEAPDAGEEERKATQRFRELQELLEQNLQEAKVYRLGHRQIQAFILGQTATGDYAGLKTKLVET